MGAWGNHEAALLLFLHLKRGTLALPNYPSVYMSTQQIRIAVWFDSHCPLCIREIALMRRLDWFNRVAFVDIYAAQSCPLEPQLLLQRFHAQETDGPIISGAAAFAALWRHLPLVRPIGELARIPTVLKLLEWAYIKFLAYRPKLQRLLSS